jgi:hypothetical protein
MFDTSLGKGWKRAVTGKHDMKKKSQVYFTFHTVFPISKTCSVTHTKRKRKDGTTARIAIEREGEER